MRPSFTNKTHVNQQLMTAVSRTFVLFRQDPSLLGSATWPLPSNPSREVVG